MIFIWACITHLVIHFIQNNIIKVSSFYDFFFFYNLSQRKAYLTLGAMLNFQMERKLQLILIFISPLIKILKYQVYRKKTPDNNRCQVMTAVLAHTR